MALCRGCGRQIIWGETATGKKVPLDPQAPVYRVVFRERVERLDKAYVSHFATCPEANRFSSSARKPEPIQERLFSEPQGGDDAQ